MDTKYELYLYGGKDGKSTIITSRKDHGNYKIKKLSYEKGLYSPNSVQIEISVSGTPTTDINTTFASKSAQLKVSGKDGKEIKIHQICTDYIVYKFRIVSSDSTKTVHLTLFSRDKLLTLDKFSRVYLNQRLGLDIIGDSLAKGGVLGKCQVQYKSSSESRMQFLYYTCEVGKKPFEAIQPYRAQYNEDFYSFISRVACQCGEALFFEDGLLTLGPDPSDTTPTKISDADIYCIEYPTVENSPLSVNDYHRNFLVDDTAPAANSLQYSDCESFDEYYDEFKSDDLPDSLKSEFYWPDLANMVIKTIAPAPGIAASSGDAVTAIEKGFKAAKEFTSFMGRYGANRDYVNRQYKANVFDSPASKSNNFQADQQKNGTALCQFADVFEDGKLKHGRLADIRKKEMAAAKQTVTVQIKTSSFAGLKLKLGCRVKLQSDNDTIYVVTACRGDFALKVKVGSKVISEERDITELEIVPLQGDKFVPPYNKCAEFTPVQPQPAIVSDDSDPRMLGRVRIRYPWQTEDSGSPWVRVLTPFSSGSGCIHFQPKKKDEVMIGYVGGNIERPYVIGSLFGKDNGKIHDNLYLTNNNTISVGSQRLDFREGTMSPFLSSFWPGWSFISQFAPGAASKMKTSHSSGWHGTTKLTDVNGFWEIEGNTADRSVTIDSAWGKVPISAYTGIDIAAVGDVTIKGKNIKIQAQNKVTIESGIAIKNARKSKATPNKLTKVLYDMASDFVKLDLSFIRTIWESVVPPKEGTLKIKSNRYLMLEAGDGAAYDNTDITYKPGDGKQYTRKAFVSVEEWPYSVKQAKSDLDKIYNTVANIATNSIEAQKEVEKAESALDKAIIALDGMGMFFHGMKRASAVKEDFMRDESDEINYDKEAGNDIRSLDESPEKNEWISKVKDLKDKTSALRNAIKSGDDDIDGSIKAYIPPVRDLFKKKGITIKSKNRAYQNACKEYLENQGFFLGTGSSWADKVNGLFIPSKYPKLKFLFGKTGKSLIPGSDYMPAYTEKEANSLLDGKIIASFDVDKSLELMDNGTWSGTDNETLDSLKNVLTKTFPISSSEH